MSSTISIQEVAALCDSGKMSIECKYIKDVKGVAQQRFFIGFKGHRGSLNITCGDCTREGEGADAYEKPFLGRRPERHPDSPPDCTTRGALTIVPDKVEGEAWVKFSRWIKADILRIGAIKNKKGRVVTTIEELESEFKDIIVEPEEGNDKRRNVCFWQKFQDSMVAGLSTSFSYIKCEKDVHGNKVVTKCGDFDSEILKAGTAVYSVISVGELKKAPTGWGVPLYTRQVFIDVPTGTEGGEPVVVFGGIRVVSSAEDFPAAPIAAAAGVAAAAEESEGAEACGAAASVSVSKFVAPETNAAAVSEGPAAVPVPNAIPVSESAVPAPAASAAPAALSSPGLLLGAEADVSGLAAAIAKIRDPAAKRQKV